MRLVLGLDRPAAGRATINGRPYAELAQPLRTVGALLEARAMHPGRSARNHLLFLAQTQGLPSRRVDEVLDLVGLREVARKRTKGYSLGMGQRVGIAAAMLGDPSVLLLDEPVNGLDPEGILWIRNLMKHLAGEGRTIFVSSHLMNEMAVTADHLIVIGKGKLIADCSTREFISPQFGEVRAGPLARRGPARGPDRRRGRQGHGARAQRRAGRGAERDRPGGAADRRDRRREPDRPARADPAARLAGGGLHGADRRQRGVRRRRDRGPPPASPAAASTTTPGSSQ